MTNEIVLLQGGFSEEREVSLKTSETIYYTLLELNYKVTRIDPIDFNSWLEVIRAIQLVNPQLVFIGLHGGAGEDGHLQGLLSLIGLPYTGSGMLSSALCMDKELSFHVAKSAGIRTAPYISCTKEKITDDELNSFWEAAGGKLVVKPNNSGSSVGISIVEEKEKITPSILEAAKYSKKVIIQNYIAGSELTVSVLDGKALPVIEIKIADGWYNFTNKYTKGKTIYQVPADISTELRETLQKQSEIIYSLFNCQGYARVDYRFDGVTPFFLEVNTLPGMTPLSLVPMAAKESGISFNELIEVIINTAVNKEAD